MAKKIALYGGSFDPPHLGHVIAITTILNSNLVDEVWLVPTGLRFDKKHQASIEDRKVMIGILLSTMFGSKVPVFVDDTQIKQTWHQSTTYELLLQKKREHPNFEFFFVIGSDLVQDIPRWSNYEKLIKETKFLLFQRLGSEVSPEDLPDYIQLLHNNDVALTSISSSLVRKMISENKSLEGLVPPAIISHIIRNRTYKQKQEDSLSAEQISLIKGQYFDFCSKKGIEFIRSTEYFYLYLLIYDEEHIYLEEYTNKILELTFLSLPMLTISNDLSDESFYRELGKTFKDKEWVLNSLNDNLSTNFLAPNISNIKYGIKPIKQTNETLSFFSKDRKIIKVKKDFLEKKFQPTEEKKMDRVLFEAVGLLKSL